MLTQPTSIQDLASQLVGKRFNRITDIAELLGVDSAKDFFNNIEAGDVIKSEAFARYIPIVKESVSTTKHDYNLNTRIVFWLADGEPYIYTPTPTIEHVRQGRSLKTLKRGSHVMIPHNCGQYDLLALREGCLLHDKSDIQELVITRHTLGVL